MDVRSVRFHGLHLIAILLASSFTDLKQVQSWKLLTGNFTASLNNNSVDGGVLEEVHPRPSTFGYVAAARVPGEGVDVVHIVCEAEAQLNFSCFDWFASARKK